MKAVFSISTKDLKQKNFAGLKVPDDLRYPKPSEDKLLIHLLKIVITQ